MALLIGLTGPLGSGKSTVVMILKRLADEHGVSFAAFSLSDEIRMEVRRRGIQLRRDSLKYTADTLRARLGNGAWATLVASRINEYLATSADDQVLIIIDAIRNPGEVRELRAEFGSRFKLLGVMAPNEIIQRNLQTRKRRDEHVAVLQNEQELTRLINTEMGNGQPDFGHNVAGCLEMADWEPISNSGTLTDLESTVCDLAKQHIFPLL